MGAASDCEWIRPDLLGQTVNTTTTIALVLAGLWLLGRPRARWIGIALTATGLGSFVFHGPMPWWGEWAHDTSLAWLVAVVAGFDTRYEGVSRAPALLGLSLIFALEPTLGDPMAATLSVVAAGSLLSRRPPRQHLYPLALLGAVALVGRLGSTGGPLCDPASPWQPHGLWHVGAAAAILWWGAVVARPSGRPASHATPADAGGSTRTVMSPLRSALRAIPAGEGTEEHRHSDDDDEDRAGITQVDQVEIPPAEADT